MHKKILFIAALLLIAAGVSAAERMSYGKRINLWEKRPPHKSDNPKDTAWVKVFLPEKSKATGRAIVICPGGGYQHLAMEHEGTDWAPVFNNMGIAAIVLHYRMPHGDHRIPIEDAEQAMRLVRHNAKAWGINPNDVGIMGSSAGGHLASTIATHAESDAKPNFQILFYPVITMD
ncbi:MAG: alpha/beta hydrolase, partial [Prevotella sp.]|nr:alpha/beta hydrolase [Prevotella sp.]